MKTPRSGAVALAVDLPGPRGHLLAPMKLLGAFVGMLAVGFLGCGGSTDTPTDGAVMNTGCLLEHADGVIAVRSTDAGGCLYLCSPLPNGGQTRGLCDGDTSCHALTTPQNCGMCGHTCSGTTPYCVTDGLVSACSSRSTP